MPADSWEGEELAKQRYETLNIRINGTNKDLEDLKGQIDKRENKVDEAIYEVEQSVLRVTDEMKKLIAEGKKEASDRSNKIETSVTDISKVYNKAANNMGKI